MTNAATAGVVAGATVCATSSAGLGCATTNLSGKYTINGLPNGEYTVLFSGADYLAQYYNGKATASEATPVSVKAGATASGVDAALEPGGKITGTVTDAAGKGALAEASVCASSSAALRCATTSASGEYTITGLPTGEYTVKFSASTYASQYYNGAETASEATPVSVRAGLTSAGINAALQVGAQISGKVTDGATNAAVSGALVCATGDVGVGCDTTNASGEYTITGLATGEYTVKFSAATYIPQYWNAKANASEATPLSVIVGTTTPGVNAALHLGGQITGKVTDEATKGGLDSVLACATNSAGAGNCGVTNEAGEYTIGGLASGEYTVKFSAATYVAQYYNGKASASEATPVSVTAPKATTAVNATLHVGGQVTGKVTAAAGKEPSPERWCAPRTPRAKSARSRTKPVNTPSAGWKPGNTPSSSPPSRTRRSTTKARHRPRSDVRVGRSGGHDVRHQRGPAGRR